MNVVKLVADGTKTLLPTTASSDIFNLLKNGKPKVASRATQARWKPICGAQKLRSLH